jgi:AcrR family transcriptional regulator
MSVKTALAKKHAPSPVHRTPRKQEILQVAAQLFADEGYKSVSLQDIADAVGLSKTTLYHYFDRKETILGTIVVSTIRELTEYVDEAVARHRSPQDRLIAFMEAQAEYFEAHQASFQVLLTRYANLKEPSLRDVAVEWRVNYENTIRNIVRQGVDAGQFHARSPNAIVRAVISSVYWLARWYRPSGKQSTREIAREYAEIILFGIARRKPGRDAE